MKTRISRRAMSLFVGRRRFFGAKERIKTQRPRSLRIETLDERRVLAVDFASAIWTEQGPGPIVNGQVEGMGGQNSPVSGAVEALAPHPTDADTLFAGTVDGGIWKTTNATSASPTWTPLTDQFPSLSVSAIAFSPLDPTNNTLFAGTGDYRSGSSVVGGGAGDGAIGLLRTTDGGTTWSVLATADLGGFRLRSVIPTALNDAGTGLQVILAAADDGGGVWRSIDGGVSFTQISGAPATTDGVDNDGDGTTDEAGELNLPAGSASQMVADPGNTSRFYLALPGSGVHRSDDGGVTWQRVNGTGANILAGVPAQRIELAVSAAAGNAVYAAVINGGQLTGLFRSPDQGANWTQLDTPQTIEGGVPFGLQPNDEGEEEEEEEECEADDEECEEEQEAGSQGRIHFSMAASPTNNNIVFLGGDRQPDPGPDGIEGNNDDTFPNSIGANNFSGRLFVVDASQAAGSQATPITNNFAGGTSPHADSRDMLFDASGNILESDDGGIYRLTNPGVAAQRWTAVIGNLRVSQFYGVAYDSLNNVIIGGMQDTGSAEQNSPGGFTWNDTLQGDGFVAEAGVTGAFSVHYIASQNLGSFRRRVFDNANNLVTNSTVALNVNGTGGGTTSLRLIGGLGFLQPYAINVLNPARMVIGTSFLFESTDGGDNLNALGGQTGIDNVNNDGDGNTDEADEVTLLNPVGSVQALAYGGRQGGTDFPDLLYVGTTGGTVNGVNGRLFLRTAITNNDLTDFTMLTTYPGANVVDIALDPDDFARAYVLDANGAVWRTTDAGATAGGWTNLTGNLAGNPFVSELTTIALVPGSGTDPDVLAVGGLGGVARTLLDTASQSIWNEVGTNLPNVRAFDLRYDRTDDVLLAGTIGRGAWTLANASTALQIQGILTVCGDDDFNNQDDTFRLVRNPSNPALLQVFVNNVSAVPDLEVPLAAVQQINVYGVGGNDSLIVDSTNGLISVTGGIRYDGDGVCPPEIPLNDDLSLAEILASLGQQHGYDRGFDSLTLTGGAIQTTSEVDVGQLPGSGRSFITGAAGTQTVWFEELEPVIDLVPALGFSITSIPGLATLLDAANTINYVAGLLAGGAGRVTIDNFEPVEFSNKTNLVIDAGAGNDVVTGNNAAAPTGLSTITVNGNDGDDQIKFLVAPPVVPAGFTSITLNGNSGEDLLSARAVLATTPFTLNGGTEDDTLVGGRGNDLLNGNDGDDTLAGGDPAVTGSIGNNTYDGGAGFDSLLVLATKNNDSIFVDQTSATAISTRVNANVAVDTLVAASVEEGQVEGGLGDDNIVVRVGDQLGLSSLRFAVHGGDPNASDRLAVLDAGAGSLVVKREAPDQRSGSITVGNNAPVNYDGVEFVDIAPLNSITGGTGTTDSAGRIVVFDSDPFEFNNSRLTPTVVDPTCFFTAQPEPGGICTLSDGPVSPNIDPGVTQVLDPSGIPLPLSGDEDWYLFRAPKIGTFSAKLYFEEIATLANGQPGLPGNGTLSIQVFDQAGVLITDGAPFGGAEVGSRGLQATFSAAAGNSYYLRILGAAPESINNYDLNLVEVDLAGPQVTNVGITGSNFDLFDPKPAATPTPAVNSLTIRFRDLPIRAPGDVYPALDAAVAAAVGNYVLIGDANGIIPIQSVTVVNQPVVAGGTAIASVILAFASPLPDDRYTLTLSDQIIDPAGNLLDGESNADEPQENPTFPSGNGVAGGAFSARFTVDSRAEIGSWASGSVYVDTNGNFHFDPTNTDFTNRDITYLMGFTSDNIFAGNFVRAADGTADGFDKLGAYGKVGSNFRWLADVNNDGVITAGVDINVVQPLFAGVTSVNGMPAAGNFDGNRQKRDNDADAKNGDEVVLKVGNVWLLDTDHDFKVNLKLAGTNMVGLPVVGDFDNDGLDDLGAWSADKFVLDLTTANDGSLGVVDGSFDASFTFGFASTRERPVAADFDGDGIDDLGLWVPDRAGAAPSESAEWYLLISAGRTIQQRIQADSNGALINGVVSFKPTPFGADRFAQFGDEFGLPVAGNFDPPLTSLADSGGNTNLQNPLDVNNDGDISPLDALLIFNVLNSTGAQTLTPPAIGQAPFVDINQDGDVSPLDALLIFNWLNNSQQQPADDSGDQPEGESAAAPSDAYFANLADEALPKKDRRS